MINPDMKVGEHFIDGNREYEVLTCNGDGTYISKFVGIAEKSEEQKPVEESGQEVVKAEEKPIVRNTTTRKTTTKTSKK